MNQKITIKVCGKWILAGEYAVLKGHPALVFPLASRFMELDYENSETDTLVFSSGADFEEEIILKENDRGTAFSSQLERSTEFFEFVLDQALRNISKTRTDLKGAIKLNTHISFGVGMGASAVVCVLIGRLFHHLNWLTEENLFSFCHSLENSLHGQSSGVDIASVLMGKPVLFLIAKNSEKPIYPPAVQPQIQVFHPRWRPYIFLSRSGSGRATKINMEKMQRFWEKSTRKAERLNQRMNQAVLKAKEGLQTHGGQKGLTLLMESFALAEECFLQWDLVGEEMKKHIVFLKKAGALAAKPTGSGMGGCVLSLWSDYPPAVLSGRLLSAF